MLNMTSSGSFYILLISFQLKQCEYKTWSHCRSQVSKKGPWVGGEHQRGAAGYRGLEEGKEQHGEINTGRMYAKVIRKHTVISLPKITYHIYIHTYIKLHMYDV